MYPNNCAPNKGGQLKLTVLVTTGPSASVIRRFHYGIFHCTCILLPIFFLPFPISSPGLRLLEVWGYTNTRTRHITGQGHILRWYCNCCIIKIYSEKIYSYSRNILLFWCFNGEGRMFAGGVSSAVVWGYRHRFGVSWCIFGFWRGGMRFGGGGVGFGWGGVVREVGSLCWVQRGRSDNGGGVCFIERHCRSLAILKLFWGKWSKTVPYLEVPYIIISSVI